jgi:ornithine carbamoyltransferase
MASTGPDVKDFLSVLDLGTPAALGRLLDLAVQLKTDRHRGLKAPTATALDGSHVALLFEKPSLRTRSTFEVAAKELGGDVLNLSTEFAGGREPLEDVARNLERWVKVLVVRTFAQNRAQLLATAAPRLHVINALTDEQHPCQALADGMRMREAWGDCRGRRVAFVGDGNNVATSLAHVTSMLGITLHVASPEGYELPDAVVEEAGGVALDGARVVRVRDPYEAVDGVDAVYTDVWASMGEEAELPVRRRSFEGYQVNTALMGQAASGAMFMHCLPAHRGQEVTPEVFESPASVVFDQAENRLHAQKALLLTLLAG